MPRIKLILLFTGIFISLIFTFIFLSSHLYQSQNPSPSFIPNITPLKFKPIYLSSDSYQQYTSSEYSLSFIYPNDWQIITNDQFEDPQQLFRILVTDSNQNHLPIHWNIGIWQLTSTDEQIASNLYPGLVAIQQNDFQITGQRGKELILQSPTAQSNDQKIYRLFIFRKNHITYSITGKYCHQNADEYCNQFLTSFKFL